MTLTEAPAQSSGIPSSRTWRFMKLPAAIAVICLTGVLVLLYPSAANWFSDVLHAQQLKDYSQDVREIGPVGREEALAEAHAYNDVLSSGATVAANERIPLSDRASEPHDFAYRDLLAADSHGLMARIKIPSIDVDLPIYHGTSESVLQKGIGHLEGTSLPVGGAGTHAVLTGHRGLASAELFTQLDKVNVGDTFIISVFGEVLTYQVSDTRVVQPDDTESLYPRAGEDLVTLVTCTPLGINSERILVTGKRILPTPPRDVESAEAGPAGPGFPWWVLGAIGAVAVLVLYVWASGRPPRQGRSTRREEADR